MISKMQCVCVLRRCAFQRLHIVLLRHSKCTCFEYFFFFFFRYSQFESQSLSITHSSYVPNQAKQFREVCHHFLNSIQLVIGCLGCYYRKIPLDVFITNRWCISCTFFSYFGRVDDHTKGQIKQKITC